MRQISPLDAAWLFLDTRDTPMHVAGLFEFTLPPDAPPDYLAREVEAMRANRAIPPPWNLRPVEAPVLGRLPVMQEDNDLDLEYHIRHSALPSPGGQRELGVLVSRLHSHQLDFRRPLWEIHIIEGLDEDRFALYMKIHHSLVDGVSAMRMIMRGFSTDPDERGMPPFWTVKPGSRRRRTDAAASPVRRAASTARTTLGAVASLGRAGLSLTRAQVGDQALQAPYRTAGDALGGRLAGQRRLSTQQYDLARVKAVARAGGVSLNDVVLHICGTSLRRYLTEHGRLPARSLTAGIPVSLRDADDQSMGGTSIGIMVANLGTNIGDPVERLRAIRSSTEEAKRHLQRLPSPARPYYTLLVNGPWIAGLLAGLGHRAPVPFSVAISNVPGPSEPLYLNGARMDAVFPMSLILQGNALNITCVSYAGTLNFGFTGARDSLPHLQRMALYAGEALDELEAALGVGEAAATA